MSVTTATDASRRRGCIPTTKSIPGINRPNATRKRESRRSESEPAATRRAEAAEAVRVAVAVPLATVIVPTEHEGAGETTGVMLQVKATLLASKPFVGAIVMVELADWPPDTELGVRAEADRVKSELIFIPVDVLVLKFPSPEYTAVIV